MTAHNDLIREIWDRPKPTPNRPQEPQPRRHRVNAIGDRLVLEVVRVYPIGVAPSGLPAVETRLEAGSPFAAPLRVADEEPDRFSGYIFWLDDDPAATLYIALSDHSGDCEEMLVPLDPVRHRHFFADAAAKGGFTVVINTELGITGISLGVEANDILRSLGEALTARQTRTAAER